VGDMALALALKLAVLYGAVTIGPTTPVCRVGVPCEKPAAKVTLSFTRLGHSFTAKTDRAGKYRIALAPGIYAVRASAGMSIQPRNIRVRAPRTHLNFSIDTGIR
jgi:hypothetical protein